MFVITIDCVDVRNDYSYARNLPVISDIHASWSEHKLINDWNSCKNREYITSTKWIAAQKMNALHVSFFFFSSPFLSCS